MPISNENLFAGCLPCDISSPVQVVPVLASLNRPFSSTKISTLALRLAASDLASAHLVKPVLLLDDIFAELDKNRRGAVADVIREKQCQVFVATPRAEDLPFETNSKIEME